MFGTIDATRAAAVAEEMPGAEVENRETKRKLTPVELRDSVAAAARGSSVSDSTNLLQILNWKILNFRLKVLPLPHDNEPIWVARLW